MTCSCASAHFATQILNPFLVFCFPRAPGSDPDLCPAPQFRLLYLLVSTQISSAPLSVLSRYRKIYFLSSNSGATRSFFNRKFFYNSIYIYFLQIFSIFILLHHSVRQYGIIRSILEGITHPKMYFHKELKFPPLAAFISISACSLSYPSVSQIKLAAKQFYGRIL